MELHLAAAAITVSTTLQTFAQIAAASFSLTMLGWLAGTGQVYLILQLIHHPIGWTIALLLESLGQAIRGAAFAIPGALGVQEGGYLLLAPLAGLPPDAARCRAGAGQTRTRVAAGCARPAVPAPLLARPSCRRVKFLLFVHPKAFNARNHSRSRARPAFATT
jgi:hypothetical protein